MAVSLSWRAARYPAMSAIKIAQERSRSLIWLNSRPERPVSHPSTRSWPAPGFAWMFTVPDQAAVAPGLAHPVQRHIVHEAVRVRGGKREMVRAIEVDAAKRHAHDAPGDAVVIADYELRLAEFGIPADTVQEILDRDHRRTALTRARPGPVAMSNRTGMNCSISHFAVSA